jgi:acetyltransferase-like isoleucine patch superfamily enzyme
MFLNETELKKIGFKKVGKNVSISDKCSIYNAKNIEIGSNVRIDDFVILSAGEGGIKIGSHIHIACYTSLIGGGEIVVEDFSQVSSRVTILSSSDDFSGDFLVGPCILSEFTNVKSKKVLLKKHSVVGTGTTILPGVTLHEGAAVGAMSLVKNDIDEYTIFLGVPAKKLKNRSKKISYLETDFLKKYNG